MKEAMRCHPGVSFPLERVVPEGGINLCGTHFEAGTIVGMNAAVIHRDKTIFGDDADQFRPERWINSDEEQIKLMNRHLMTVSSFKFHKKDTFLTWLFSLVMGLEHVLEKTYQLWKWANLFLSYSAILRFNGHRMNLIGGSRHFGSLNRVV